MVDDGRTGLLVDAEDIEGLAGAIGRLAGDARLREQLGATARQRMRQRFSLDAHVNAVERVFDELAGADGAAVRSGTGDG
jgi:glycosyltransferase involved in cell wall biosynthesis